MIYIYRMRFGYLNSCFCIEKIFISHHSVGYFSSSCIAVMLSLPLSSDCYLCTVSIDIQLWSLLAQLLHTDHQEVLFQWMLFLEICSIHTPYLEQLFTECIPITSFITCILSILSNTHITHPEMLYALLEVLTAIFHTTNESMKYAMCNLDLLEAIDNLQVRIYIS